MLGIHGGRMNIGEHLEFIRTAHIVTVAGHAIGNHLAAICALPYLLRLERLNHAVLLGHALDPAV